MAAPDGGLAVDVPAAALLPHRKVQLRLEAGGRTGGGPEAWRAHRVWALLTVTGAVVGSGKGPLRPGGPVAPVPGSEEHHTTWATVMACPPVYTASVYG